ncbi:hypothetical protein [Burkholderia cenocepacia]|uniref:hypothetical protein n=1 Tax=Burkholderia cenocepacia TaxID=95486 RepID=UPI001588DFED|nr:hypothetical protein [Burkholderia cenocepacia]
MNREYVAKAIEITGALFGLAIAYQAVRFCQGVIGAPILDQPIEYFGRPFALALDQQLGLMMALGLPRGEPDTAPPRLSVLLLSPNCAHTRTAKFHDQ